ncbi:MAG: glycerol-3-phosphate 1-O-acyltransferase PlsY [Gemmatimonadota bacterium]|nr:glycerol-3-phosphate 1-O-acyltransferase PlsY [Gemmatimonadota bacterium]
MSPYLALALSYLLGSIPSAYLAGRVFRGIDLREHGSGNLGATNVLRTLGWKIALLVMIMDLAKGAVPAALFPRHLTSVSSPSHWAIAFGLAAILGHVRSAWMLWRGGGKGVATAAGVFLALTTVPSLIAVAVWAVVLLVWGYVSLASISAALVLPVAVGALDGLHAPVFVATLAVALFVLWTHRANIGRLRRGEEQRFGRKRGAAA